MGLRSLTFNRQTFKFEFYPFEVVSLYRDQQLVIDSLQINNISHKNRCACYVVDLSRPKAY